MRVWTQILKKIHVTAFIYLFIFIFIFCVSLSFISEMLLYVLLCQVYEHVDTTI